MMGHVGRTCKSNFAQLLFFQKIIKLWAILLQTTLLVFHIFHTSQMIGSAQKCPNRAKRDQTGSIKAKQGQTGTGPNMAKQGQTGPNGAQTGPNIAN